MKSTPDFTDANCLKLAYNDRFHRTNAIGSPIINEFSVTLNCGVRRFVERLDEYEDGSFTLVQCRTPVNQTQFEDGFRSPIYSTSGWDLTSMRAELLRRIKMDDTSTPKPIAYGVVFVPGTVREIQVELPAKVEIPFRHKPFPTKWELETPPIQWDDSAGGEDIHFRKMNI